MIERVKPFLAGGPARSERCFECQAPLHMQGGLVGSLGAFRLGVCVECLARVGYYHYEEKDKETERERSGRGRKKGSYKKRGDCQAY